MRRARIEELKYEEVYGQILHAAKKNAKAPAKAPAKTTAKAMRTVQGTAKLTHTQQGQVVKPPKRATRSASQMLKDRKEENETFERLRARLEKEGDTLAFTKSEFFKELSIVRGEEVTCGTDPSHGNAIERYWSQTNGSRIKHKLPRQVEAESESAGKHMLVTYYLLPKALRDW